MSTQPRHHMPRAAGWLRTRAPWVLIGILLVSGIGSAAYAFWQSISSSNFAAAAGDTVMPGSKPSASASGADISVSWTPGTTASGRAVTGYTVARYNAASGGSKTPATGACAGTVTVLSCAEHNVPGGIWFYTVTPVIGLWTGAESPRSGAVSSDSTPPVASVASISPTPNASGFNNSSPVIVNLTAQDNTGGSGVASITYAVDSATPTTVNAANAAVTVSGDGTHVVSYFATDNTGNASASQNLAIKIDTVAPGAPSIIVPTYVNSANVSTVPVSGTAEPGSTLTLTVTDPGAAHTLARTVTVSGSGAWTASGLDLTSLNQGTVTYAAKATDAAGNTGATVTVTSTKDTLAPAAPTISAPLYINGANVSNVPVSGTAEAGASVTLVVTDGAADSVTQTATASGTGAWSTTGLNLTALNQGAVTYTATATDAAGNSGASFAVTKTKDTLAPGLPSISVPLFVNAANVANVPVSGTAEPGATIALSVTDPGPAHTVQQTVTANGTGDWSTTALSLTALNQGTVTYQVTATDAAGNVSATKTTTNTKDVAPPTVTGVALTNINGTAETGDSVTITYSEPMDASKFCTAWNNTGSQILNSNNDVVVTLQDNGANDTLTVSSTTCPSLNIGTVSLGGNYISSATATFRGSQGNKSTVQWDPLTLKLTIVLGTNKTGTLASGAAGFPSYTPGTGLTDLAGNALSTTPFTSAIRSGF